MTEIQERQVWLLQDNLSSLRKIAGWTADELGARIGVTKQTISNLENKKNPMNLTQYIAIRAVFDYKIFQSPRSSENKILQQTINLLLDSDTTESDYKKKREAVLGIAGAVASGVTAGMLLPMTGGLLMGMGIPITIATAAAGAATAKIKKIDWMKAIQPGLKNNPSRNTTTRYKEWEE